MKIVLTTFILLLLLKMVKTYIDIPIQIERQGELTLYNLPIDINSHKYKLTLSLTSKTQYITALSEISENKKHKKNIKKDTEISVKGIIKASSLEGYTFEGWKRFFMEALLYIQQRYYHDVSIDLDWIQQRKGFPVKNSGLMCLGPNIQQNNIFLEIKKNTEFIKQNVIGIYSGASGKNARLQLGGYQQSYAYGHKNGVLFYQINITKKGDYWMIPFQKLSCLKQHNNKWDEFMVNSGEIEMKIDIESAYIILPVLSSKQIQRNFQSNNVQCGVDNKIFYCVNMSSIDLALNFLTFKLKGGIGINISLYDLRNKYDQKTKTTTFFIKFDENPQNYQISDSILKTYYMVINMETHTMMFSPINRFPQSWFQTVYVIRFLVGFTIFTIIAAIGAAIWQTFNDPYHKKKLHYGQQGVRLVSYQKPNEQEQD